MHKISTPVFTVICLTLSLVTSNVYSKPDIKYQQIKEFIPDGYEIYDTASGDFNADGLKDYVLVLKSNAENSNANGERPLLVLTGAPKGKFTLLARNDSVVLCETCGGVFGDPYSKVSIKSAYLSVEHSVGGNWQWSRVITFKYNKETREMVLNEDITKSFKKFEPSNQKSVASNKSDYGVLSFTDYSYNKGF